MASDIKKAALYIRVSTEDQAEFSPDAQKRLLMKYASENGYTVSEDNVYIDEGISGRAAEKRPAFMKMIAAAKSKDRPFDTILVHKYDRFARSREDSVIYKSLLRKECGVRVVSISEKIEDDKFGIILEAVLEAMAEFYSLNLSDEVKKGMTEKARRGGLQTNAPFGYRAEGNVLVQVPDEAETVREIFKRFVDGDSFYKISKYLNSTGKRTKNNNKFESRSVEYILKNPVYIGKLRWNPKGKTHRNFDDPDIIISTGKHLPIIDDELFKAAAQRIHEIEKNKHHRARPENELRSPLSGILKCSECGGNMVFVKPHYYKCGNYIKGRCDTSQHVNADVVLKAVLERLERDMEYSSQIPLKANSLKEQVMRKETDIEKQISFLKLKENRLLEAWLSGALDNEKYRLETEKLKAEKIELKNEKLRIRTNSSISEDELSEFAKSPLSDFDGDKYTIAEKNSALGAVIERCIWDKASNTVKIIYGISL